MIQRLTIKTLADALTSVRPLIGFFLVWLGWKEGKQALPLAAVLMLLAWITDILDGPLARMDRVRPVTWIGQHDLEADLIGAGGVWLYLWLAGFLSTAIGAGYLIFSCASLWLTGSMYVGWGIQVVPFAAMIGTAVVHARPFGWMLIAWLCIIVVVTWPRLPREKAPEFLRGIALLFRK
ncbi:MAG: CDP-alcohol phosphatidyltransferase family protein [Candidatus Aminicenantales bacterium]